MKALLLVISWFCLVSVAWGQSVWWSAAESAQSVAAAGGSYSGTPDILWWKGNTGSGTTDTADVGPNCTLQSADMWATTFTPGGSTSDLLFAGYRYGNAASSVTFATNIITVEFRVYSTNYANTVVFRAYAMASLGDAKNAWGIANQTDAGGGKWEMRLYDNSFNLAQFTIPRPVASSWYHVAIVFDNSAANAPTVYTNGVLATVTTVTDPRTSFAAYTAAAVYCGSSLAGAGDAWDNTHFSKDVRIFSGARSAENIAQDATNYP